MTAFLRLVTCSACVLLLSSSAFGQFFPPTNAVPEIDPAAASGAIAIVSGGVYLLRTRFGRARSTR